MANNNTPPISYHKARGVCGEGRFEERLEERVLSPERRAAELFPGEFPNRVLDVALFDGDEESRREAAEPEAVEPETAEPEARRAASRNELSREVSPSIISLREDVSRKAALRADSWRIVSARKREGRRFALRANSPESSCVLGSAKSSSASSSLFSSSKVRVRRELDAAVRRLEDVSDGEFSGMEVSADERRAEGFEYSILSEDCEALKRGRDMISPVRR